MHNSVSTAISPGPATFQRRVPCAYFNLAGWRKASPFIVRHLPKGLYSGQVWRPEPTPHPSRSGL